MFSALQTPVFISYRRDDAHQEAALLADLIRARCGSEAVFHDTSSVAPGAYWPLQLENVLKDARCVIVIIGPEWLGRDDASVSEWVRREVEAALVARVDVVPVLVNGGALPPREALPAHVQALADRQAIELRRDYFRHDARLLLQRFQRQIEPRLREALEVQIMSCQQQGVKFRTPHVLRALLDREPSYTARCFAIADTQCLPTLLGLVETFLAKQSEYESERGFQDFRLSDHPLVSAGDKLAEEEDAAVVDERHLLLAFLNSHGSTATRLRGELGRLFERVHHMALNNRPGKFDFGTPMAEWP